jgi:hypothetical protein
MSQIDDTNLEEYWFEGEPFKGVNSTLDTGTEEYWFEGEPIKFLLTPQSQQNQQGNFFVFFDAF